MLGGSTMTDAERHVAARQFTTGWSGQGGEKQVRGGVDEEILKVGGGNKYHVLSFF